MTSSENDSHRQRTHANEHGFARIELPPVPQLRLRGAAGTASVPDPAAAAGPVATPGVVPTPTPGRAPATNLDGRPVGGFDEPARHTWQSPFPAPQLNPADYSYQVVPPPAPVTAATAAPELPPAVSSVPPVSAVPPLATMATSDGTPAADDTMPIATSTPVLVMFAILAVGLVWASKMAFSAALLGFAALLVSELAIAMSLARRSNEPRSAAATALAAIAGLGAVLAAKGAFAQFGEMAFVAGLFVLISVVPALLLLGATSLMLKRRNADSPGDRALRDGTRVRFVALAAILLAGIQAHRTFSAKPDAIVALAIVALIALNVFAVARRNGRAAAT